MWTPNFLPLHWCGFGVRRTCGKTAWKQQTLTTWWSMVGRQVTITNFRKLQSFIQFIIIHFWLHPLIHIFVSAGCSCNGLRYWHHSEEDTWLTLEFFLMTCTPWCTCGCGLEQSLAVQIPHSILAISSTMDICWSFAAWYESYAYGRLTSYLLLRLLSLPLLLFSYRAISNNLRQR